MEDYSKMYYRLYNKITDVIKELQNLQQEAEEMYISQMGKLQDDDDEI